MYLRNVGSDALLASVEAIDPQLGIARLKIIITGEASLSAVSSLFDKGRFTGKSATEIKEMLLSSDAVSQVEIQTRPFWIKKLPSLKDHIEVIVEE